MIFKTRKERRSFLRAVKLSTSYMIYKEQKYRGLIATYDNIVSDNEGHNDSESDNDDLQTSSFMKSEFTQSFSRPNKQKEE